ncbi:MAG: hypothetical protein Ta2F_16460 [Termitinemataceae bacterium]|nr:MAG: hypothetical protein Ta2F_16460 [Termitinemataceae bacterium]
MQKNIKQEMSLLCHFGKIIKISQDPRVKRSDFFNKAKPNIKAVCEKFKIKPMQALFLAYFIDQSDDRSITLKDIAAPLKLSKIQMLKHMDYIDGLVSKKIIRSSYNKYRLIESDNIECYYVPSNVINAVRKNQEFIPENYNNLNLDQFFSALETLFYQRKEGEIKCADLVAELKVLLKDNKQLNISETIINYNLDNEELVLLLRFCHLLINEDDDYVGSHNFDDIFDRAVTLRRIWKSLQSETHKLCEIELLEPANRGGFGDPEYFKLTDKAKEDLLAGLDISKKKAKNCRELKKYEDLVEKKLFYNEKEEVQIKRLTALLHNDNYKLVEDRLGKSGMRTGFACIFSGAPGTGKTETAYQIARETKRAIFYVNISETKSMWFGESEKKIKEIFDKYRAVVDDAKKAEKNIPILLFNEADAVISKRRDIDVSPVAQTENAIQNIILQEIENLNGILIATTNLTENIDKAFERRFIFKIDFEKPALNVRTSIWLSIIPDLSAEDAASLSKQFNFSGGQIENIARKRTVDTILSGNTPTLKDMIAYCQEEHLGKSETMIGFSLGAK